jgi:hypothetical protein
MLSVKATYNSGGLCSGSCAQQTQIGYAMRQEFDPDVELTLVRALLLPPPDPSAMRLTHTEHRNLKQTAARCFGPSVGVRLFGSHADDTARGGDIDLLIEVATTNPADIVRAQILFMARLLTRLGDRKVDDQRNSGGFFSRHLCNARFSVDS